MIQLPWEYIKVSSSSFSFGWMVLEFAVHTHEKYQQRIRRKRKKPGKKNLMYVVDQDCLRSFTSVNE